MALTLQELFTKRATVSVWDGAVNIEYNPDKISAGMLFGTVAPKEQTDETMKEWLDKNIENLVDVMVSWDLYDKPEAEGGQPIPITKEFLMEKLPFARTMQVYQAIMQDFQVGEGKGGRS